MSGGTTEAGQTAERVVARLRPHTRALFWPNLLLIAGAGTIAYFSTVFEESWQNLVLVAGGGILILLLWLVPLLRWAATRTVITTRRVIVRTGLASRSRREVLHSRGYEVTVRQRILQSMLGCGDVVLGAGEDPLVIHDVPRPALVQEALHDLVEESTRFGRFTVEL